jgi:hypothetical protein
VLLPAAYDPSPASRTVVDACWVLHSCFNAPRSLAKRGPAAYAKIGGRRDVTSGLSKSHCLDVGPFAKKVQSPFEARASLHARRCVLLKNSACACSLSPRQHFPLSPTLRVLFLSRTLHNLTSLR